VSEKPPDIGPTAAGPLQGAASAAGIVRARSRHQRHIATTQRLHALRATVHDEATLLGRTCDILCDAFTARATCIARRTRSVDGEASLERRACSRRDVLTPCAAGTGSDPCRALMQVGGATIGEARLQFEPGRADAGGSESGAASLVLELQLSDGEVLAIALQHPFDALGRDLASDDLREDLSHLEEIGRVLVDVLNAERTLARLKLREAELNSMLGAIPDILTIVDADGIVVEFHNGDNRLSLDPSHFLGRHVAELLPPDVWRAAAPILQRALLTGRMQEYRYSLESEGRTVHLVSRGQAFGEPARVLWHTRDVTDERRLQERLLSIQRFEGIALLASALAHDFSNLLTGILGNAEFARIEMGPASPAADALGDVISAARRASDLCQQLLGVSGKRRFSLGFVNLSQLCEGMLVILRTSIGRRVTVVRDLTHPDLMPVLIGDAIQLRQIVLNLLSNASDAIGDEGGIITVRTGVQGEDHGGEGQWAYLEVEDSGRGMDEVVRRRLLEPFFALPIEARELGLAATFGIVRGHGGTVEVGTAESGGTRVRVLLPLERDAEVGGASTLEAGAPATSPTSFETPSAAQRGGLVLVVTADPALVLAARRALEQVGHRVQHIGSGEEALIALRAIAGLLRGLIIDVETTGPGGAALVEQLTALAPQIPRIILGGDAPTDEVQPAGRPLTVEMLGRALARLVAQL